MSLFNTLFNHKLAPFVDLCLFCWLKLVDVVALDSALCNKEERKDFLSYLDSSMMDAPPSDILLEENIQSFHKSAKLFKLTKVCQNNGSLQWFLLRNIRLRYLCYKCWELKFPVAYGLDLTAVRMLFLVDLVEDDQDDESQGEIDETMNEKQVFYLDVINACPNVNSLSIENVILNFAMITQFQSLNFIKSISICWGNTDQATLVIQYLLSNCPKLSTIICLFDDRF